MRIMRIRPRVPDLRIEEQVLPLAFEDREGLGVGEVRVALDEACGHLGAPVCLEAAVESEGEVR